MRIHLCVVGRLRKGSEHDLITDYLERFEKIGRNMGFSGVSIHAVEAKKSNMAEEAVLLRRAIPQGAKIITLDERGKLISSPDLAHKLRDYRDDGCGDLAFIIGGADGIDPSLRNDADFSISFGKMVWPHMLARIMLSEQLYRGVSILSGSPYHRA